ncbi:hypothetical protein RclHR1_07320014 [Rhizophagus clarus]|uniref:Uncharacterized protein n=1 Tax=Rhizophagus clarus TaxID=94130 RepID=A0A2Z6RYB2_9GLOM|nr:hypothetical protein RclHR1_07320014 [Rhizophagus clarus]
MRFSIKKILPLLTCPTNQDGTQISMCLRRLSKLVSHISSDARCHLRHNIYIYISAGEFILLRKAIKESKELQVAASTLTLKAKKAYEREYMF